MKQGGRPRRFEEQPDSVFGEALKEHLRRVKNFTQAELARESMIAEKTLSNMVKGNRTSGPALRRDLRTIIKVLYQKKALFTLEEANRLITTIPAISPLDHRDPEDAKILALFNTPVAEIERVAHIEDRIQGILRNNAVVDHTHLFGVDTFIEKIKEDISAPQAAWIISLCGEGGLGKTAIAYEVVARYAASAGFTRVGWVSAKTLQLLSDGVLLRAGSAELHWSNLVKKLADQLDIHLDDNSSGWITDFQREIRSLSPGERCLLVVDNLETVDDVDEAIEYLGSNSIVNPHKILLTTRHALLGKVRYLVERHVKGLDFEPAYTPLFKYRLAKSCLLQAKALLDAERDRVDEAENHEIWVSSMDTIHHYLGRIVEGEGHVQEAMYYYVEAYRYLQMFAQEPRARLAFYHLRLGELLISASLVEQARDHLLLSQEIFDAIQFSSSGRLQVSLAWAALYGKEGNYARAREYILTAREETRSRHFSRGELWCLVKLFWLESGHFYLYRVLVTFLQALGTWRHGELRRNEGFRLFGHYLLQVLSTPFKLLKRTPHTVMGAGTLNARLNTCICPLHQLPASSS